MKKLLFYFLLFTIRNSFAQVNSNEDEFDLRINIKNQGLITVSLVNSSCEKINYYGEKPVIQFYHKGKWKFSSLNQKENKKCANYFLQKIKYSKENNHVKPHDTKSFDVIIPKGNYKVKTRFFLNSLSHQKKIYSKEIITSIDKAILEKI
ncbi:MAG: hypothetical protein MK202_09345 [Tenacibaculum sp.]|nr:hypothetical protein [Tenacibaculum sp.]